MGALGAQAEYPPIDDPAAWRTMIEAQDQVVSQMLSARVSGVVAERERREIEDAVVYVVTPESAGDDDRVVLDLHGGALILQGGEACAVMATMAAAGRRMCTWGVDYRMPPDHPYPTPLDDCVAVYRALLEVKPPERIVVAGGSAGGNLAAALMLRARAEGLAMPKALMLFTPEADLTESGDTFDTNAGVDYVLLQRLTESIALYAGDHDLRDPFLSPLFGDLSEFPPTFLQSGTRDLFLSNTVRMHRALRAVDVDAELHVWEAMPHGGFFGAPEDLEMGVEARKFLAKHL
jgi:monoterpene epsilon-lactone hydrolase